MKTTKHKIIVNRMLLIVTFGADLGGIVVTLNSIRITIKVTFNGYNYGCDGILCFVQLENSSRKLIKFDKNCLLSCDTCLIRMCVKYSLLLIVTIANMKDERLCKSRNFDPLLMGELIQTKTISNEQEAPQMNVINKLYTST